MAPRKDTDNYRRLFLDNIPLLDTRAAVEFEQGAFPGAVNMPLLDDEQRQQVGIRYKQAGQQAAIELGEELVGGEQKQQRLAAWSRFAEQHPQGYLYCFRGGLRSRTVQQWLRESGIEYPLVLGGYKAMRRFLLEELSRSVAAAQFILVAGKTGTGKTRVIAALERAVDLEGLALHRGSTFGQLLVPQPSQIDFENAISIALMKLLAAGPQPVMLEDEGRLIGRLALPDALRERMQSVPMLLVEEPLAHRIDTVLEDYVVDLGRRFAAVHGARGAQLHRDKLLEDLAKISKRLGGERHREIETQLCAAFAQQQQTGGTDLHRHWIEALLVQYYDPMYEYQLARRTGEILGSGSREAVTLQARSITGNAA